MALGGFMAHGTVKTAPRPTIATNHAEDTCFQDTTAPTTPSAVSA